MPELTPIVIDFSKDLNEGWTSSFSTSAKQVLRRIFGHWTPPIRVRGSKRAIEAFAKAIKREANYIRHIRKYGLHSPATYRQKYRLKRAVQRFEEETGIKWPFTDDE